MPKPSIFEMIGERILLLLVGPLDKLPALYARGRLAFVLARGVAYASVMTLGLALLNVLSQGPMFRAPLDVKLLLLRLGAYWLVQLFVGIVLSIFIWRMVERLALLRQRAMQESASQERAL